MSLNFTSLRVFDTGSITPVLPHPAALHILPGGIKVDLVGREIVPTAWVSLALVCSCEGRRVDGPPVQGKGGVLW